MPGVFRPYTLVDVLGTINQQSSSPTGDTILSLGVFAETDESMSTQDTVTTSHAVNPPYENATWGTFTWA